MNPTSRKVLAIGVLLFGLTVLVWWSPSDSAVVPWLRAAVFAVGLVAAGALWPEREHMRMRRGFSRLVAAVLALGGLAAAYTGWREAQGGLGLTGLAFIVGALVLWWSPKVVTFGFGRFWRSP
jgi:hypothetical protein